MLPEQFLRRMQRVLGHDFEPLVHALTEGAPVRALRRTGKGRQADVPRLLSAYRPTSIPYADGGFYFEGEHIGHTPLHHAGGIYVQDPGAMSAVAAVDVHPAMRVADLCAAPGGKSSQVAARLSDGWLLANEFVPSRARITVQNFERLGLRRTVVTSLDTASLTELYDAYFDLVIVDAPCSGEGMFRKNELAISEWSEENVLACAERQAHILDQAAALVTDGGRLLYATCTFSPEENELTVDAFLDRHPDFVLVRPHERVLPFTAPGLDLPYRHIHDPSMCRRFYPHIAPGEGQFFAVLERQNAGKKPTILCKNAAIPCQKNEKRVIDAQLADAFSIDPSFAVASLGGRPILLPCGMCVPPCSATHLAGVPLGEVRSERLIPHHYLFSAFGTEARRTICLDEADPRVRAYLHGEEISADVADGFAAVLYEGIPLGGGKITGGRVKNHYPKGLRERA